MPDEDSGADSESLSAQGVEHRLRRLLGAATTRFEQMRADMRELERYRTQHDSLLAGLETLLQAHKSAAAGEAKPQSPSPDAPAEAPSSARSASASDASACSPVSIRALLGRIDETLSHVDRVLDGQPDPEKKAWAAERTNLGPAPGPRDDKSSMTIEELRAHVRKMSAEMAKDREEISALSHHAEQAISFWSERTPDLSPCSLQALPDLSPCSLHASSTSGSPSVHRKVASPLAFSSKPTLPFLREATATEAHAEKTQAIHKAKEQALRMAREECNRVFSSGSSSGSVGLGLVTARDEWHAKQGTSVVIDVPLPQKENTSPNALQFAQSQRTEPGGQLQRPAGHAVQSYGGSINLPHSSQQPQQQQPSGRSSVGQPIVINLGFAKKHAPQKSVRQVPLQVLSQQQRHVNQPFPHSEKQQQQQQANANVFATYTQVHFDTQKGVVPDGFAIAKPVTVAYNTSCSNWVGSSASILHRGPRLLPKEEQEARRKQRAQQQMEADFDKENLHIKCCK